MNYLFVKIDSPYVAITLQEIFFFLISRNCHCNVVPHGPTNILIRK